MGRKEMTKVASEKIGWITAATLKNASDSVERETLLVSAATTPEVDQVIETVSQAFLHDPTWSWAFPAAEVRRAWWTLCIRSAFRYPHVFKTSGYEVASVWIPPDGVELTSEEELQTPDLLEQLVGPRAPAVMELLRRFGDSHPRHEPHYYLSLLAVADHCRGRGLGMALLRENLARIDADGAAAYLESSNPTNNPRYQALGFVPVVSFEAPDGGPTVTGMWRDARR